MKKFANRKVVIAASIAAILLLGIITIAAPSANKERVETDYITELSAEAWTDSKVYSDGYLVQQIELNDKPITGAFEFSVGDKLAVSVPQELTGGYRIGFRYHVDEAEPSDVLFNLGYGEAGYTAYLPLIWKDGVSEEQRYPTDRYGNERANTQVVHTESVFTALQDNADINMEEIELELAGGTIVITNTSQKIILEEIWLYQEKEIPTYAEYCKSTQPADEASGIITVQGEDFSIKSDPHIRSNNTNKISLVPYNTYYRMINVLDGTSFGSAGQKVMWEFEVEQDGWYEFGLKFCQNSAVNKKAYREIEIDGAVPFEEFSLVSFEQTRNITYETMFLADSKGENYKVYLTAGKHTIAMTAMLGDVREVYDELKVLVEEMNTLGMDITKITAGVSDKNRTWDLDAYLPNAVEDMEGYIETIEKLYERLEEIEGEKPTYADSLLYAMQVLEQLLEKPRTIPNNLDLFNTGDNSAVKHINTVINNLIKTNLGVDELYIKAAEDAFVEEKTSPFVNVANSVRKFLYSLDPEAVQSTNGTAGDDDTLQVWMSRSSVYVQVLQSMADSAEELEGIQVDISIMPSEQKLVLASAAGTNPDVVIGAGSTTPYKFAIRGAAKDLTEYEDFLSFYDSEYNLESLVPCAYDGGVYGATETQDYRVLFYRKDILDTLGIQVPDTWDDVQEIMPTLLRYNKNISLPIANVIGFKGLSTTSPFIYQNDGKLYTEDGAGIGLMDGNTIEGMNMLTDLFKVYAVEEYVASFYNSFRYGETPLGIGGVSSYVQLTEAAPELAGLWDIAPVPGTLQEDGTVLRSGNAAMTTCMIFKNTNMSEEAWTFMKWWLSAETQTAFAETMELSYGTEYRWNTANMKAFEETSYPDEHKDVIRVAWENQKENLQHPASYIVEREISNAFTNATVNGDTVIEALDASKLVADREIMRKLKEFGYVDSDGNLERNYPIEVMKDIEAKLKEQTKGGEK
ncbi:MAG: extracellular solute-binding protein [Tyzzerella sp.]|nr:extracellular solute-binding protein [Tyzzerella sp.]